MEKHLLPLRYTLSLMECFDEIDPKRFHFNAIEDFYGKRMKKSEIRFENREIYCFMCEMKARIDAKKRMRSKKKQDNSRKENIDIKEIEENSIVNRYLCRSKTKGLAIKKDRRVQHFAFLNEKLKFTEKLFYMTAMEASRTFQANIKSPQFLDCLPDHVITSIDHHDIDALFTSFLRYCPDQSLRKDFWTSYMSRGSPFQNSISNNLRNIEKIRTLRQDIAETLGYDDFAQMALDLNGSGHRSMIGTLDNVIAFINELSDKTQNQYQKNLKEINEFALEFRPDKISENESPVAMLPSNILIEKLNIWDLKYFERMYLKEIYQFDSTKIRPYFQLDQVINGMLKFTEKLFNIKIVRIDEMKNVWGPNVRYYKIFDNSPNSNGEYGSFYFDPYHSKSQIFTPLIRSESMCIKPSIIFLMDFKNINGSVLEQFEQQQLQATGKELLNFYQVIRLFEKVGSVLKEKNLMFKDLILF